MRIALIARRFDPAGGGTERDLIVTAQCLAEAGHELSFYTAESRGAPAKWPVVRVGSRWPSPTLALMRFAWEAPARARRAGADLVFSFARAVGADILRSGGGAHGAYLRDARRWRGEWAAAAMRMRPYHRAQMIIERAAYRSPSLRCAVAVSELVRRQLIVEFGIEEARAVTLYNGVDLERFRPPGSAERERRRRDFDLDDSAPALVFAGNGFARKGLGSLIAALPSIRERPWLLVAGADRSALRYARLAQRLGAGSRVRFLGAVAGIERLFQAADAFALPSFFEPFGNVVMEAMACGLGAVSSTQSGVAELLPAAMRPFVVHDPADSSEIALRTSALLQAGDRLAAGARAVAEAHPWSGYAAGLRKIIDSFSK